MDGSTAITMILQFWVREKLFKGSSRGQPEVKGSSCQGFQKLFKGAQTVGARLSSTGIIYITQTIGITPTGIITRTVTGATGIIITEAAQEEISKPLP